MGDQDQANQRPTFAPLVPVIPGLAWTEIRAAAIEFASHGWPILPGTYEVGEHGSWLGKPRAVGLEPVADLWQLATTTSPETALDWWTRRPYSVLLACGAGVDAVEVPAAHGRRALMQVSQPDRGPVAATPFGSWLFFVRSDGDPLHVELAANARAKLHSRGAWLPLPPTGREGVAYRWKVSPAAVGWVLPASTDVQRVLISSLSRTASVMRPRLL